MERIEFFLLALLVCQTCDGLWWLLRSSEVSEDYKSSKVHNFKTTDSTHHLYFAQLKKKNERRGQWVARVTKIITWLGHVTLTRRLKIVLLTHVTLSRSPRSNTVFFFWVLRLKPSEVGGIIFSGQGRNFEIPLISCSDRSPACCHSGHPSIHSEFCQRQVPDSVFWAFDYSQHCVFAQDLPQQWSNPPILRVEEKEEIHKNISSFLSPSQPMKSGHFSWLP